MNDELMVDFSDMTEEELINFKENLESRYDVMCDERAKDLVALQTRDFDPFSTAGEKKIKSIIKKYEEFDDGFLFLMEELIKEMKQRQINLLDLEIEKENKQFESLSSEEYIRQELEKNKIYRNKR